MTRNLTKRHEPTKAEEHKFTRIARPPWDRLWWRGARGCSLLTTQRQPKLTRWRRRSTDRWRQFRIANSSSVSLEQKLQPDQRRHPATPASKPCRWSVSRHLVFVRPAPS